MKMMPWRQCRSDNQQKNRGAWIACYHGNVMMDLMYRIPSDKNIKKCTITKAMVEGTDEAVLEYRTGAIETEN